MKAATFSATGPSAPLRGFAAAPYAAAPYGATPYGAALYGAAQYAADQVASVRDDPAQRLALPRSLYQAPPSYPALHLPYRRGALAFMGWQLRRGVLNPLDGQVPGVLGGGRSTSGFCATPPRRVPVCSAGRPDVLIERRVVGGVHPPTIGARAWYRAHNATIVTAYLKHRELAENESQVERFFINLVLVRVLYAHALVAAPRLALSRLAPIAPALGDPGPGMTGLFLSLSRVLPDRSPLRGRSPSIHR